MTHNLAHLMAGTVVRLESGQPVVVAPGPGHGRRYVMQETGVLLDVSADQEVEILGVPWKGPLAKLLILFTSHLIQDAVK